MSPDAQEVEPGGRGLWLEVCTKALWELGCRGDVDSPGPAAGGRAALAPPSAKANRRRRAPSSAQRSARTESTAAGLGCVQARPRAVSLTPRCCPRVPARRGQAARLRPRSPGAGLEHQAPFALHGLTLRE